MVWKIHNFKGSWVGPARVIKQDDASTVFCNNAGSIIRAAPEHIRPVSAVEARLIPIEMPTIPQVENTSMFNPQNNGTSQELPSQRTVSNNNPITRANNNIPENEEPVPTSQSASEQPDQEPEEMPSTPNTSEENDSGSRSSQNQEHNPELQPHEIPVPDVAEDELLCDLLLCSDDDNLIDNAPNGEEIVWRAELEFSRTHVEQVCQSIQKPTEEEFVHLTTTGKRARTEVKLSTLDPNERLEFEEAKTKEVRNWLQTGTVAKMFRHELSPEQILRCRWLYVWKPIEDPKEQKELGGKSRKAKARLVVLGYTWTHNWTPFPETAQLWEGHPKCSLLKCWPLCDGP